MRLVAICAALFCAANLSALELMKVKRDSIKWTPYRIGAYDAYVIEHFATFCGPCRKNAPRVDALAAKLRRAGKKVEVLHMANEEPDHLILAWYRAVKPKAKVVRDEDWTFTAHLRKSNSSTGVPATYVINSKQEVQYVHVGTWDSQIEKEIYEAATGESPTYRAPSAVGKARVVKEKVPSAATRAGLD